MPANMHATTQVHWVTMLTFPGSVRTQTLRGLLQHHTLLQVTSQNYLLLSFHKILQFRVRENPLGRIPCDNWPKQKPFLSMCYGDPSAAEVSHPPKINFLHYISVPVQRNIFMVTTISEKGATVKKQGFYSYALNPDDQYYTVHTCMHTHVHTHVLHRTHMYLSEA